TTGACLYPVSKEVLLNPEACINFIEKHAITVLHVTPTQYQYLVHVGYKLKDLKYLFIGAEKLTYDLVQRSLASVNENCRVFNMYGPTEATIISAVLEIYRSDYQKFAPLSSVPIGIPVANTTLLVLDKYLKLCPLNITGELYIGGDGIAHGYLNNPELTSEKFCLRRPGGESIAQSAERTAFAAKHAAFLGSPRRGAPGPPRKNFSLKGTRGLAPLLYQTGDQARWLADGNIEFLGRVDFQVKVRGFRIELGEIENQLLTHEKVREAVVIDYQGTREEKYLCAYIVPTLEKDFGNTLSQELREYLSQTLPDYMIPSYFIRIEKIPLNPNGKVNRRALPIPEITEVEEVYTPPRDETEEKLAAIWAQVLGRDALHATQLQESISIDNNFFQLGGHSLKATIAISKIHQYFNVKLTLADIFKTPTIRGLSVTIKGAVGIGDKYYSIEKVEEKEYYVLSSAQKRLYILDQVEFASTGYNIPAVYQLAEEPDRSRLEEAFRRLIQRHENFRTSFIMVDDEPMQKIHDEVKFEIEYFDLATEDTENPEGTHHSAFSIQHSFVRPFDLSRPPLLRVGLIKTENAKSLLLVDMHHIVSDGISMEIFQKELIELYDSKQLSPLLLQYKDYAQWYNQVYKRKKKKIAQQQTYWLKEFAGEIPVLNLPTDYIRPVVQSFEGNKVRFGLEKDETRELFQLAEQEGLTLFMVLLAVFNILLAKLAGQEDIVVGTPTAGRPHADLENIIGMFINTLGLRNYPQGEKPVKKFLQELKTKTLQAFENQDYQFEELVDHLEVPRDAGRNPLFDVMFALQNLEHQKVDYQGLKIISRRFETHVSKFDMTLYVEDSPNGLYFSLGYCTKLFKGQTIKQFIRYFQKIISVVTAKPGTKISEIEIISREEKRQIMQEFNNTGTQYTKNKTIPGLFEKQVEKTPDHIAVAGPLAIKYRTYRTYMTYISYRELNKQSHQLAQYLYRRGIKTNEPVGIMAEKSLEMIVGILGILKAGCAYVPLDPQAPLSRTKYLLQECGASL
ncbi:MAG: AMP-binding protein, partial [Candidatus Aminicenantes bacterium]